MTTSRLHCPAFALALLAASLFANGAQAFTFEDQTTANSNSSSNLNNPSTSRFSSGGSNGQTTIKQGNATFQFGGQQRPSDQRYYPEQLFSPNRPGDGR